MPTPDQLNGLFECCGAFFTWKNAAALYRDRRILGVYWPAPIFFTVWGVFNLGFYPAVGLWWSFVGGLLLVGGNIVWTVMAIHLWKKG